MRERRYHATARSGENVTHRLVDVEVETADYLGISPGELHAEVVEGLVAGLSVTDSVSRVMRSRDSAPPSLDRP